AGIGPDDQALVPIELVDLPGKPTEKGMATVHPDDAETNRFTRTDAQELAITPSDQKTVKTRMPTEAMMSPSDAEAERWAAEAQAWSEGTPTMGSNAPAAEVAEARATETSGPAIEAATGSQGGEAAPRAPEASWTPPAMAPPPPPSPVPAFAPPSDERPEPVEPPARSTVPAVKLPPRSGPSRVVIAVVVMLAAAGGLAIWAGVGSGQRATTESTANKGSTAPVSMPVAADLAQTEDLAAVAQAPADLATGAVAVAPKPTVAPAAPRPSEPAPAANPPAANPPAANPPAANPAPSPAANP